MCVLTHLIGPPGGRVSLGEAISSERLLSEGTDVCVLTQSCVILCDPIDCSPPGSSVHGILQAGILEGAAVSFSRDLPAPGIEPAPPALAGRFFTLSHLGRPCCL